MTPDALDALFAKHDRKYRSQEEWLAALKRDLVVCGDAPTPWCQHLTWLPEQHLFAFYDTGNFDYAEWTGSRCPFVDCRAPRPSSDWTRNLPPIQEHQP